jgi:hypothetical protein
LFQKASELLFALPQNTGPTAQLITTATGKLKGAYSPHDYLDPNTVKVYQDRYVDAIVAFINGIGNGNQAVSREEIRTILTKGEGSFFYLCNALTQLKYISVDTLDSVSVRQIILGKSNTVVRSLVSARPSRASSL